MTHWYAVWSAEREQVLTPPDRVSFFRTMEWLELRDPANKPPPRRRKKKATKKRR